MYNGSENAFDELIKIFETTEGEKSMRLMMGLRKFPKLKCREKE